ncbi:MAG: response regulator [Psychromonas sp.]|nr:response regulator [Psychromonas sp.]
MIFKRLSTKSLFSIYIILSALILAGIGGLILSQKSRETIQNLQTQTLQVELQTSAKYLQLFLEDKKRELQRVSQLPFFISLAMGNIVSTSIINDHLTHANALQAQEIISFYDIANDLIYSNGNITNKPTEYIEQILLSEYKSHTLIHRQDEKITIEFVLPITYQGEVEGVISLHTPFNLEQFFSGIFSNDIRWVGFKQDLTNLTMQPPNDKQWEILTTHLNPDSIELLYAVNQKDQISQQHQLLLSLMKSLLIAITLAFIVIYLLGDKLIISPYQQLSISKIALVEKNTQLERSNIEIEKNINIQKQLQIEANKARIRAEHANSAKSQFLATISHEIRTPMNGVLGATQLMLKTEVTREQNDYLQTLFDSGHHMMSLLNDVLDYSKIEAGKLDITPETTQLILLDEFISHNLSSLCQAKGINFEYINHTKTEQYYSIDKARVNQILLNLISNAVKFTNEGQITVTINSQIKESRHYLFVEVEGTGIGIDNANLNHIFEEFTQAEETTTRQFGGTGLGLSIVKNLVGLMQGEISVNSKIGVGTRFAISILAPVIHPIKSKQKVEAKNIFKATSQHVLIVEDNKVNAMILAIMLKKRGITSKVAVNGKIAVDLLAEGELYDLIIMDNNMPVMDGVTASKAIKNLDNGSQLIPIIGYTADAHTEIKELMQASGCLFVMIKPLHERDLDSVLTSIFVESE